MRDLFTRRSKTTFIIIFKLRFTKQESAQDATANINGIKEALEEDIAKYLKKFSSYRHGSLLTRLYVSQKESLDATSRLAYNELMHLLDLKQDVVCFVQVPNSAAVMTPSDYGGYTETHENIFLIERRKQAANDWGTKLQDRVDKINTSPAISQEVKDRISSALRYLRMGDTQLGIEQKFINYWIGLEFIFSSASSSESTYNRMCHHFITIMKSCYIKRHLLFMGQLLREKKCIGAESKRYWEMTTDEQDALYDKTGDALLKYRLKKMKAHLWHGDSKKQFLKRHEERLKQNLERIYRLRNQFIHEAAINESDISHVTSNLRSYLTFILNQLLTFFDQDTASTQPLEMDHFFWQHEHCMRLIENSNWDVGAIMGVQMGEERIK